MREAEHPNQNHYQTSSLLKPQRGRYLLAPLGPDSLSSHHDYRQPLKRYVSLPAETIQLLKHYRAWQNGEHLRLEEYYQAQGFVFAQDTGGPMHPDSVTT